MKERTRVKKSGKRPKKKRATRTIAKIRAAADDPSRRGWMAGVGEFYRPIKRPVTLRLDADVVAWFKAEGRGYQTRINRALRKVMMEEGKRGG
ncbi:MAG TPA: BrnA antitoxin family protein [Terriglobales bacterium]|nr:BrnA antitoxin family protein [Terriglobales bacterium]